MKRKLERQLGAVLRAVLCWPFVGLLAVFGVRFALVSNPGRIGHLATEVDAFLKESELGLIPRGRTILLISRKRAANRALLDCFRQHMTVWDHPLVCSVLAEIARIPAVRLPLGRPIVGLGEAARYPNINWLWGDRPPAVRLTPRIEADGRALLTRMGVPGDAWFVALHVREEGYSPADDSDHAHRNADISTYQAAIRAIVETGGWVIRVGDASMTPLAPMDRVVDYATSPEKTDWMDLWLCAHCRFLIGTTSGAGQHGADGGGAGHGAERHLDCQAKPEGRRPDSDVRGVHPGHLGPALCLRLRRKRRDTGGQFRRGNPRPGPGNDGPAGRDVPDNA
jgi:hypothetical protein